MSSSTNANTPPPPPPAVNTGAGGQYALGFTPQPSPSQHVQNLKDPPEKKAMKQTTIPATRPFAVTPTKRATPAKNPYITRSQPKAKRREEMNDFALAKAIEEEEDVAAVNILENFEAAQALQSLYATATNVHVVQEHQARASVHTHQLTMLKLSRLILMMIKMTKRRMHLLSRVPGMVIMARALMRMDMLSELLY